MSARTFSFIIVVLLFAAWLGAGCGAINPTQPATPLPPVRLTQPPTFAPTQAPSATASVTPLMPSPTPSDPALQTAQDFLAALEAGNTETAAGLYSNFSLMLDEITRGEAAAALKAQAARGETISAGQVLESRVFDERTHLVHVRYQRAGKAAAAPGAANQGTAVPGTTVPEPGTATATQPAPQDPTATLASGSVDQTRQAEMIRDVTATAASAATAEAGAAATPTAATASAAAAANGDMVNTSVDEWWPIRLESGQWRYNRNNLIDYQTLDVPVQTTAGLTVKPRQIARYTDHLRLTLLVQNQTNEAIVFGQPNEVMATFLFGDKPVETRNTRLIFEPHRSYPDTAIDLQGMYETFPDGIILRKWKGLQVKPWFEFRFE